MQSVLQCFDMALHLRVRKSEKYEIRKGEGEDAEDKVNITVLTCCYVCMGRIIAHAWNRGLKKGWIIWRADGHPPSSSQHSLLQRTQPL